MPVNKANVDDVFSYHKPEGDQPQRYENIRAAAREFAHAILDNVPQSADQQAALRLVREAVMTANAGVALRGAVAVLLAVALAACSGVQGGSPVAPSASGVASTSETSAGNGPAGNPVGPVTGISLSDDPATDLRANVGADFYHAGRAVELSWLENSHGGPTPPKFTVQILRESGGRYVQIYKVNLLGERVNGRWVRGLHLKPGHYKWNVQRENVAGTFSSQGDRSRDAEFTVEDDPALSASACTPYQSPWNGLPFCEQTAG
ncbi:MAG: hypothetical protein AB7G23_02885 [Vicinamibacterales bacterium]